MSWSWSSNKMFCLFPTEEEGTQLANAVSNICRQIEKREQFLREITKRGREQGIGMKLNLKFWLLLLEFNPISIFWHFKRKTSQNSCRFSKWGKAEKSTMCTFLFYFFFHFRLISTLCSFAISIFWLCAIDIIFDLFLQSAPPPSFHLLSY